MATALENLQATRANAAAALAASNLSTDSPEHIDKLLKLIKELDALIDSAATRDADTGALAPFEEESRDAI